MVQLAVYSLQGWSKWPGDIVEIRVGVVVIPLNIPLGLDFLTIFLSVQRSFLKGLHLLYLIQNYAYIIVVDWLKT